MRRVLRMEPQELGFAYFGRWGRAATLLCRREPLCETGVLTYLVVVTWVHTYNDSIGRLDVLKGELERRFDFLLVTAHSACREDLETQARLVNLPDYFGHSQRVRGKERIANLGRHYRRHFFKFLRRPGQVVETSHEKIDRPVLISNTFDAVGIVG